ncbi:MAG: L-threonylcarbamoyladenylate synthase [Deltaproteobacteria bacterium]|nr:L-threonylcarbamoyladenylate synthase [Deltaproteobacteria bacterium]
MRPDPIGDAVQHAAAGGLVGYPTETVWGLGVDATSEAAIGRLRDWKGRADDAPISILIADMADLEVFDFVLEEAALKLAGAFWPGPLTLVIPCRRSFASGVGRSDGAVGVRCSAHPLAAALARRCEAEGVGPLTATSLNRTGSPAAKTRGEADANVGDGPDAPRIVDVEGSEAGGDLESTVVDVSTARPEVLRWGSIRVAEIDPILQEISRG